MYGLVVHHPVNNPESFFVLLLFRAVDAQDQLASAASTSLVLVSIDRMG